MAVLPPFPDLLFIIPWFPLPPTGGNIRVPNKSSPNAAPSPKKAGAWPVELLFPPNYSEC
jgi:hypothetical protein